MTKEEFSERYRHLHFNRFRFFPDPPEIEFEWNIYIDERDGSIHAMITPPREYYGKTWWRLSFEEREEALQAFSLDIKFDEEDFGRWYFERLAHQVGRWKTLVGELGQGFPIN